MPTTLSHSSVTRRTKSAFSLVELLVTIGIVSGAFASLMALSGRMSNMLRSANDSTMIGQVLQERLEMIRASSWQVVTSEPIPGSDDTMSEDDASDEADDPTNEVLTDPTEFPDDLTDADASEPGLLDSFSYPAASASQINVLTEEVIVSKYPEGSTPIRIRRDANGTVTVLSHNPDLADENMVRVVMKLTWKGAAKGETRTQSAQIVLTKSSQ